MERTRHSGKFELGAWYLILQGFCIKFDVILSNPFVKVFTSTSQGSNLLTLWVPPMRFEAHACRPVMIPSLVCFEEGLCANLQHLRQAPLVSSVILSLIFIFGEVAKYRVKC